jgi:hypothetical protein
VLNNLDKIHLLENSILAKFYELSKMQSPLDRAATLENMREFQEVHKAHAAQGQSTQAENKDDVKHHFIAFVKNAEGQLVELDGMKHNALVVLDKCDDLLKDSAVILQQRLEAGFYSDSLAVLTLSKVAE